MQKITNICLFMVLLLSCLRPIDSATRNFKVIQSAEGDCKVVKKRVCEGQVHKVRDDGTKIRCSQGKFKAEKGRQGKAAEVDQALEDRAKNSCQWYGQTYCGGDIIVDLYRWWFQLRCVMGEMEVVPVQWQEVVNDPRFLLLNPDFEVSNEI